MANFQNNAFTYEINPIGTNDSEDNSVHQVSPAWVLTFLRWAVRDTLRTTPTNEYDFSTTVPPLVVESDCIQLNTNHVKDNLTPSMSATLLVSDVNYETALAPGDFVFVNILNWDSDARRVAEAAKNLKAINGPNDGFKGIYKVQSVRKNLATDQSGRKHYAIQITGYAFTEFNNAVYFNKYLETQQDQNLALYVSNVASQWSGFINNTGTNNVQDIMQYLIDGFLGVGVGNGGQPDPLTVTRNLNVHFLMPKNVGNLLGLPGVTSAKDIYVYLFGKQQYASGGVQTLANGMNPVGATAPTNSRYVTGSMNPCDGSALNKVDYWDNIKLWSILNQYCNGPINELYTCFKITKDNKVLPTLVFRQIPFTSSTFTNISSPELEVTYFMNLPRWKVNTALALSFDLGKDEALRFNFVQYFGKSTYGAQGADVSSEIVAQNYVLDIDDVERSGLRPYITQSTFDEAQQTTNDFKSPGWAKIVGDAVIGGHLRLSGTVNFVGIVDPITVGDNLEFDSVVYHIESVTHMCLQNANGTKTFRTTVSLSHGVNALSTNTQLNYDEMTDSSAYNLRTDDYQSEAILPGISETQNSLNRSVQNPEPKTLTPTETSFVQPNTPVKPTTTIRGT